MPLLQPHPLVASHSSLSDKQQECWMAVRKNTGTMQKWMCETRSCTYASGLPTASYLCTLSRSLHHHPFAAQGHLSTIHSTFPTVYPIPGLHFCHQHFSPYDTHPLSPCVETMSILSDSLFPATPFLFQPFYTFLHS